jgi:sulfur-oxidizing protein SoxX
MVIALPLAPGAALAADAVGSAPVAFQGRRRRDSRAAGATPGDAARGRNLVLARDPANCLLCHAIPDPAVRFAGDLGPALGGIGARLSIPQLRLRVADIIRLNSTTIMPSYYRIDGLSLVRVRLSGKPILTAAEIEDVVAYLATLR